MISMKRHRAGSECALDEEAAQEVVRDSREKDNQLQKKVEVVKESNFLFT